MNASTQKHVVGLENSWKCVRNTSERVVGFRIGGDGCYLLKTSPGARKRLGMVGSTSEHVVGLENACRGSKMVDSRCRWVRTCSRT